jgi:Zn-dependent protease with chaperone function
LIYSNLLYLLIIIFIFSTSIPPQEPRLEAITALIFFAGKGLLFYMAVGRSYAAGRIGSDRQYFNAEQRLTIAAIIMFAADVYLLDCKYYLQPLTFGGRFPALLNLAGISLFFGYLSLIWLKARKHYTALFGRLYSPGHFIIRNIKFILPFILPWLIILFVFDLITLLSPPGLDLPDTPWLENALILILFVLMAATFPALVRRLWNCTPLPEGPLRHEIERFCREQNFKYTDIMLWPLYEGKMLTAGVMGIFSPLRYLLITPALLNNLDSREIEAVMAHEIGHIKKHHLYLYLLIVLGLGILITALSTPINLLLLQSDLFYKLAESATRDPLELLLIWSSVPIFLVMIVYFRYIFGFFMRNFERQADLHVFKALGDITPLVSSFEKIAWLSGNIRDQPSWHHFSIGQRVDFLLRCRKKPLLIKKHDRKVYGWLLVYCLAMILSVTWLWSTPDSLSISLTDSRLMEATLNHRIRQEPDQAIWHRILADLYQESNREAEAIREYRLALSLKPDSPETINNLAWLLVTTEDTALRNPQYGLELALQAVKLRQDAHILDTLAEAYWLNGFPAKAVETERLALSKDPQKRDFYLQQIAKFQNESPAR